MSKFEKLLSIENSLGIDDEIEQADIEMERKELGYSSPLQKALEKKQASRRPLTRKERLKRMREMGQRR